MLIEFSIANYKSFKERVTFSMVASNITSPDRRLDQNNVASADKNLKLLKCAAIYGANGSGKSNLADACRFMRNFVEDSSKESQTGEEIGTEPFRLNDDTKSEPSFFEIVFIQGRTTYRYGFEVDNHSVKAEWLFHVPSTKEAKLFEREGQVITAARSFKEAKGLTDKTRVNALFLSVLAQFNGTISKSILNWFRSFNLISGLADRGYRQYTVNCFKNNRYTSDITNFVKRLDLGFQDLSVEPNDPSEILDEVTSTSGDQPSGTKVRDIAKSLELIVTGKFGNVKTIHPSYNAKGEQTSVEHFDLDTNESEGTRKLFFLAGPLMDTLKNGKILFVDELDARLHPLITYEIIKLFNSAQTNPQNAQLIFATHDTNLLNNKLLRRDQIWFVEKDRLGASHLHSLVEYRVRNDASFEKNYIRGKYGAIPFIGDLDDLFGVSSNGETSVETA
jgi:AAA15 family ATPase/GTPase